MAEEMKSRGLSRLAPKVPDMKKPEIPGVHDGEDKTHTIEDHGDGSFTSRTHDGESTQHPDHLHLLAHLGHHLSGGDKHHVAHHDGMSIHTHGIHEDGNHEETQEHESPDEATDHFAGFMGDDEPEQENEQDQEAGPSYGGF